MSELEKQIAEAIIATAVDAVGSALRSKRAADAIDTARKRAIFEAHRIAWLHAADAVTRAKR